MAHASLMSKLGSDKEIVVRFCRAYHYVAVPKTCEAQRRDLNGRESSTPKVVRK